MFIKDKKKPLRATIPADAKVSFVVRYNGGRKPFDTKDDAMSFAETQRSLEKGWAEVTKTIEIVVSPR